MFALTQLLHVLVEVLGFVVFVSFSFPDSHLVNGARYNNLLAKTQGIAAKTVVK